MASEGCISDAPLAKRFGSIDIEIVLMLKVQKLFPTAYSLKP